MTRSSVLALLLVGCASAGQSGATGDGSLGGGGGGDGDDAAAPQDAPGPRFLDARADAHLPLDAFVPKDAPADAFVRKDAAIPDACVPKVTQLLANPVFDLSPMGTGWTEVPIDPMYPPITDDNSAVTPQSAPYMVWEGGITGDDEGTTTVTDQVYQDITVPAGTTELVVTGDYIVATTETTTTAVHDTASFDLIQTDGTEIENVMSLSNLTTTPGSGWATFSHTFTHIPAGQKVRLRMTSTNNATKNSNFFFDTLALNATHCP